MTSAHPGSPGNDATCPVCTSPNRCGVAAGRGTCWCFHAEVQTGLVEWLGARGLEGTCLCEKCASGDVASPCTGECALDESTTYCVACGRTAKEIGAWSTLEPIERAKVWFRLREPR